jgi:P-type Cu+ transporter
MDDEDIKLESDPVCGIIVDTTATLYMTEYGDERFYFCSPECKDQFEASPKSFIQEEDVA